MPQTVVTPADLNVATGHLQIVSNKVQVNAGSVIAAAPANSIPLSALNPVGSTAGQVLTSTGAATAPTFQAGNVHTHTASQITDFNTASDARIAAHIALADPHAQYQLESQKDAANGYAGLDATGKINPAQLPALAITDTSVVATQVAMLALTAEVGDIAVRTDLNKTFILKTSPATVLANWQEILAPTGGTSSVFGRTGAVTAANGDYTAAQITNVAAGGIAAVTVQAAINELDTEKLNLAGGTMTGLLTLSGAPTAANHAATKGYVDGSLSEQLVSMGGVVLGYIKP